MLFQISKDHKIYLLLYSVKIFHHSEIFEYTDALNLPNLRVDFCIVYPSHEIDFTMPGDIRRPFSQKFDVLLRKISESAVSNEIMLVGIL